MQCPAKHLPDVCLREFLDELDVSWLFVASEVLPEAGTEELAGLTSRMPTPPRLTRLFGCQIPVIPGNCQLLPVCNWNDKYLFESDPQLLRRVCDAMVALIPASTDLLGGLELGCVPLATVLVN